MADLFDMTRKRSALDQGLSARLSANTQAKFLAKQRGARKLSDLTSGFKIQTPKIMSAYGRRGLAGPNVQTGVYERGLQDFAKSRFQQTQDLQDMLDAEQNQLSGERAGIESQYNVDVADLEAENAWRQAQTAALLQAFKPYLGG